MNYPETSGPSFYCECEECGETLPTNSDCSDGMCEECWEDVQEAKEEANKEK